MNNPESVEQLSANVWYENVAPEMPVNANRIILAYAEAIRKERTRAEKAEKELEEIKKKLYQRNHHNHPSDLEIKGYE